MKAPPKSGKPGRFCTVDCLVSILTGVGKAGLDEEALGGGTGCGEEMRRAFSAAWLVGLFFDNRKDATLDRLSLGRNAGRRVACATQRRCIEIGFSVMATDCVGGSVLVVEAVVKMTSCPNWMVCCIQ